MNKIKTYIDSGVLIAAFRGTKNVAVKATEILDYPQFFGISETRFFQKTWFLDWLSSKYKKESVGAKHSGDNSLEKSLTFLSECFALPRVKS